MAGGSNDVTVTTVSGLGGGGVSTSSMTVVDVTATLCLPPAYDSLLPLYDNKDLPKYHDVVGTRGPVSQEPPPPSYDDHSTCSTQQSEDSTSTPVSHAT